MPRELSVIYGSITVGGASTTFLLTDPVKITDGPDTAVCEFDCVVYGSSEALYEDNLRTFETAFRTARTRLRVVLGSETLFDWNPADGINTGFNHRPTFTKIGDANFDSGRTMKVAVRIECDLPADTYAQSGRRTSEVTLSFSPARRRTLTITGEYRALTTVDSARQQYTNNITAYVNSILATSLVGAGGTWDLVDENSQSDDTDKICTFTIVYEQLIFDQAPGVRNHAAIKRDDLRASVIRDHPGDSPSGRARRLVELAVSYNCWIDETVSPATTANLRNLWEGTIRTHCLNQMRRAAIVGAYGIMNESPEFDPVQNRISASMRLLAVVGGSMLEYRITQKIHETSGIVLAPAHDEREKFAKYAYQGPARRIRTTSETLRVLGAVSIVRPAGLGPLGPAGGGGLGSGGGGGGGGGHQVGIFAGDRVGTAGGPSGVQFSGGGGDRGTDQSKRAFEAAFDAGFTPPPSAGEATSKGGGGPRGKAEGKGSPKRRSLGRGQWVQLDSDVEQTPLKLGDPTKGGLDVTDISKSVVEEWYVPVAPGPTLSTANRDPLGRPGEPV